MSHKHCCNNCCCGANYGYNRYPGYGGGFGGLGFGGIILPLLLIGLAATNNRRVL